MVGEGDDQLWGSGRGAIAGCHCSVLWWGKGRVTTNFGGVVVPLQGAVVVCFFPSILMTPKLFFVIWGLCWYNVFSGRVKYKIRFETL